MKVYRVEVQAANGFNSEDFARRIGVELDAVGWKQGSKEALRAKLGMSQRSFSRALDVLRGLPEETRSSFSNEKDDHEIPPAIEPVSSTGTDDTGEVAAGDPLPATRVSPVTCGFPVAAFSATSPATADPPADRKEQTSMDRNITPVAVPPGEAAQMLGISRAKLYELIGSNSMRSIKLGGRRLIPVSAIHALFTESEAA